MKARTIVLDIETYRTTQPAAIERIRLEAAEKEPPKTASKDVKIWWDTEKAREERFQEALSKTAVDPMLAEILCIVVAIDDDAPLTFSQAKMNESQMLHDFASVLELEASEESIWIGHNIEGFDLPVILNRFRRLRVKPPTAFPAYDGGRFHGRVYDTMKRTPGRTPFISMEAACEVAGIVLPQVMWRGEPMHGGRVADCFEAGEWRVMLEYCRQDVITTRELYHALTFKDTWGTYPRPTDLAHRLEEIERDESLTESQKAITQKALMKGAGAWPR
jgi:predicted PolB exonuclease-like 3'-5' exonuclease